jgi:hypothetical protein
VVHSLHAECEHPRLGPKAHLPAHLVVKRRSRVLIAGRAYDYNLVVEEMLYCLVPSI